jgi:arginyl-tRNA synthetase
MLIHEVHTGITLQVGAPIQIGFVIRFDLLFCEIDIVREGFCKKAFSKLKESPLFVKETAGPQARCWVLKQGQSHEGNKEVQADKVLVRSNGY